MEQSLQLLQRGIGNLGITYDRISRAVWVEFKYQDRPCFTSELLEDVSRVQRSLRHAAVSGYENDDDARLLFQVLASSDRNIFSLGGDLDYFIRLIEAGERAPLEEYAALCVKIQHATATHYGIPFTSIALVEGEALGGGFEAALSANVLIAEQRARFGFPEITFGMFPGMGALSLLIRKITPAMARRLIMDHRIYTATELYDLGIVDVLVADGEGRSATMDYMQRHISLSSGHHGFQAAVDRALPLNYSELGDIVELWVDTAMMLSKKNLKLMKYFARAQEKRSFVSGVEVDDESSKLA